MHATAPTLLAYYKSFKSVSGVLATATGVGPLLSAWLTGAAGAYAFPPLGGITTPARLGVVILAVGITYTCFYSSKPAAHIARRFLFIGLVSVFALVCYLLFFQHFVRRIDVPANGTVLFVSVGYQRTAFAEQTFNTDDDWEMLRARGTSDEDIVQLWTARSVDIARLLLFASYGGFLLPLVGIFSLGVRYQM